MSPRRPPDAVSPAAEGAKRRDSNPTSPLEEDRYPQGSATQGLQAGHVTGIDGWPALAAWLEAVTR